MWWKIQFFNTFVTVHQSFLDNFLVNSFASFSTDLKAASKSTFIRTHTVLMKKNCLTLLLLFMKLGG
jgi:hypothetical protein